MNRNKQIQSIRMYNFFIDATCEIIKKEGVDKVTARKIGEIAGYTSSTIYNYFDELSHLVFFAAMRFLDDYNNDLSNSLSTLKKAEERFLVTWEIFCTHSFRNPEIFHAVFISDLGIDPNELINRYYQMYDRKLNILTDETKFIVLEHNLYKRNEKLVKDLANEGVITPEACYFILHTTVLTWHGMMIEIMNNRSKKPVDTYIEDFQNILYHLLKKP